MMERDRLRVRITPVFKKYFDVVFGCDKAHKMVSFPTLCRGTLSSFRCFQPIYNGE